MTIPRLTPPRRHPRPTLMYRSRALALGAVAVVTALVVPTAPALAAEPTALPPSVVSSVSPSKGPTAGGTSLMVSGSGFKTSWTSMITAANNGTSSIGLATDGVLYGWGSNNRGGLGNGTTDVALSFTPVTISGTALEGKTIKQISVARQHSLALDEDGRVYTWGETLLAGQPENVLTPIAVPTAGTPMEGKRIVQVSAGVFYSLAVDSDGVVYGWGSNMLNQLGMPPESRIVNTPQAVITAGTPMEGKRIVSVAAGEMHSAAIDSEGKVYTWGFNRMGALGNSTTANAPIPVAVTTAGTAMEGKKVAQVALGMEHTLAVTSDGQLFAWGNNSDDQAGVNFSGNVALVARPTPVAVTGSPLEGKKFTTVRAVHTSSAALDSDGKVYTWGVNTAGQLGVGHTSRVRALQAVRTIGTPMEGKKITDLSLGSSRALARAADGSAYAWGYNYDRSLGADAPQLGIASSPISVDPIPENISVSLGSARAADTERHGDTTITATTPAGTAGTVDVTVTANGRTTLLPDAFTYQDVPDAPADASASTGTESPTTAGTVTWSAPSYVGASPVTSYAVRYRAEGSDEWVSVEGTIPENITTASLSGLSPNTRYAVEVAAINASGESVPATSSLTTAPDRTLASLTVTPSATEVAQGDSVTLTLSGANAAGDPLPVNSADVQISSDRDTDDVDGTTVTFPTSGERRVTATVAGVSAFTDIQVSPRYVVTWDENWPDAGEPDSQVVEAERLSEVPDPSAAGWVITEWNTRADGSGDSITVDTDLASVAAGTDVTAYAIWERRTLSLDLSAATAESGDTVTLTATANGAFGETVDATTEAGFTSSEDTDVIDGNTLVATVAGERTVTAEFDDATATAELTVTAGPLDTITLTPSSSTVTQGGSVEFSVSGRDSAENTVEVDPADVVLTSDVPTDVVDGLTVTFPTASPHVITATIGDVEHSVTIEVQPAPAATDTPVSPEPSATPTATDPGPSETPPSDGSPDAAGLASTGGAAVGGAVLGALVLLIVGAALLYRRRSARTGA
ncbi:MAG: RCC1 domain-containing protein [Mycetocola sp.]